MSDDAKPDTAKEIGFYLGAMLICPHCGTPLDRMKLKESGYVMIHAKVAGCPLSQKKFAMPMFPLKEIK